MMFMSTARLPRAVRKPDKTRSSSLNHPDPLIGPMMAMISSTISVSSTSSLSSTSGEKHLSKSFNQLGTLLDNQKPEKFSGFHPGERKRRSEKVRGIKDQNVNNHPFRNLIFSPEITPQKFKDHLSLIQRGLIYSKACLKQPSTHYLKNKYINLSEKKR